MAALGLAARAVCIVSGDTLNERKPHPAPMWHACHLAGSLAHECVYVGDAARDIEAGRAAGMHTLVALYGYLGAGDDPNGWGADALIQAPRGILDWLDARWT
jgi:phosphoglycolate phosphatase